MKVESLVESKINPRENFLLLFPSLPKKVAGTNWIHPNIVFAELIFSFNLRQTCHKPKNNFFVQSRLIEAS
jgi:hypothetical protein